MDISINLPLDNDGFLRRECPHCMGYFKWHHGPANEEAEQHTDPDTYYCPLCGQPAGPDSWWTTEQLEFAQGAALPAVLTDLENEFGRAFKKSGNRHLRIEMTGHFDTPDAPSPLSEPDDMAIITSPCHGYEPVKVPEDRAMPFYCLVCGRAFAV